MIEAVLPAFRFFEVRVIYYETIAVDLGDNFVNASLFIVYIDYTLDLKLKSILDGVVIAKELWHKSLPVHWLNFYIIKIFWSEITFCFLGTKRLIQFIGF